MKKIQIYECKGLEDILNASDMISLKHEFVKYDQSGLKLKWKSREMREWSPQHNRLIEAWKR